MERLAGFFFCLALLGGISLWYGGRELATTWHASESPEPMKLAELIARGREGNPHVEVTDFKLGSQFAQIRTKDEVIGNAYVPLIPPGEQPGSVAIYRTNPYTAQWMDERKSVSGMVGTESLPKEAQRILEGQYRLLNFDNAIVIGVGRPEPAKYGWGFIGLGVALILPLPLAISLSHRKDRREREKAKAADEGRSEADKKTATRIVAE
jgi:hypothetical protein